MGFEYMEREQSCKLQYNLKLVDCNKKKKNNQNNENYKNKTVYLKRPIESEREYSLNQLHFG